MSSPCDSSVKVGVWIGVSKKPSPKRGESHDVAVLWPAESRKLDPDPELDESPG